MSSTYRTIRPSYEQIMQPLFSFRVSLYSHGTKYAKRNAASSELLYKTRKARVGGYPKLLWKTPLSREQTKPEPGFRLLVNESIRPSPA